MIDFVDAVHDDAPELPTRREAVRAAVGDAAFVDACAVLANFQMMTRIADATGIPLDDDLELVTQKIRDELGVNGFAAAENTPPPGRLRRGLGRLAAPLAPTILKIASAFVNRKKKGSVKGEGLPSTDVEPGQ